MKVIFHCIDSAKINGWILYKTHREQLNISLKNIKPLLLFTCEFAEILIKGNTTIAAKNFVGRPKRSSSIDYPPKKIEAGQHLFQHLQSDMMDPTIGQYMARKTVVSSVVLSTVEHIAKNVMFWRSRETVLNYSIALDYFDS